MARPKIIEDSVGRTVRLPKSYWEGLSEEADKSKRPVAQIIRERLGADGVISKVQECVLPLTMFVPCGEPEPLSELTQPFEDVTITLRGPLTALVTKNSFVGIAKVDSMLNEKIESISNNDRLLMIPKCEFEKEISPGMLVLTQINYKHDAEPRITLKKYADIGRLKANNPKHKAPEPDDDTESFEALAVCAGVLEKTFI